ARRSLTWRHWRWPNPHGAHSFACWITPHCYPVGGAQPRTTGCWPARCWCRLPKSSYVMIPARVTWSRSSVKVSTCWVWGPVKSCVAGIHIRSSVCSTSGLPCKAGGIQMTHTETVTQTLTGNGLLFERTEKIGGKTPWWWIKDARRVSKALSQTYRHREMLKAYGCRWSRKRRAWYYIGTDL